MTAARLGKALDQRLRAGVEKQHAQIERVRQVADDRGHFVERAARARVDRDGETCLPVAAR